MPESSEVHLPRRERRLRQATRPVVTGDLMRAVRQSIIGTPKQPGLSDLVFLLAEAHAIQKLSVRPAQIQEAVFRLAEAGVFDIWAYIQEPQAAPRGLHRRQVDRRPAFA